MHKCAYEPLMTKLARSRTSRGLFSIFYQVTSEHGKSRARDSPRTWHTSRPGIRFLIVLLRFSREICVSPTRAAYHADFSDEFKGRRKMNWKMATSNEKLCCALSRSNVYKIKHSPQSCSSWCRECDAQDITVGAHVNNPAAGEHYTTCIMCSPACAN